MIKGFISAVVFISACMIGVFINKNKKQRAIFYKDFLDYITIAIDSIKSSMKIKKDIDSIASMQLHTDFNKFLSDKEIPKYINENEKKEINLFFTKFGEGDLDSTIELLTEQKIKVGAKADECAKELKGKGAMILKLSILAGIALVILLI